MMTGNYRKSSVGKNIISLVTMAVNQLPYMSRERERERGRAVDTGKRVVLVTDCQNTASLRACLIRQ
jgi:hypothetical protein